MSTELPSDFISKIRRRAIVMDIGGFHAPADSRSSWFGKVSWCSRGEAWPHCFGNPLQPLAQINLIELPFRPPRLDDIAFLTVFIDVRQLPNDEPNGSHWCLRAYRSLDELVPLAAPELESRIRALPMRSRVIEADHPILDDLPCPLPNELEGNYYDHCSNMSGFKLGGWPTLIQSEIFWAPWNRHPHSPEYIFQIDSVEKGNWHWGDGGVGYFGRGTAQGHRDEWSVAWQCY